VTISNISGGQLTDIRYRRTMDWDPPPAGNGETYAMVTHHGVKTSVSLPASQYPRVLYAGNNGWGSGDPMALDYMASGYTNSSIFFNQDFVRNGLTANQSISQLSSRGSSFIFQFGDLSCGQSVSFLMYYGASNVLGDITSGQGILGALSAVGVEVYSIGESSTTKKNAPVISYPYAFGFKGVSGTAIPPSIAAKTAILPLGISTNPNCIQTYSPPLLSGSHLYQSNFFYRKNSDSAYNVKNNPECGTNIPLYSGQWMGDISRYDLDSNGNPIASSVISAASLLNTRAASKNVSFSAGGRSIWTVGNNPVCNSPMLSEPADYNNFTLTNSNALGSMLFNCAPPSTTAVQDLINFVRGLDSYWEGNLTQSDVRPAVLADIFHSEMTMIGPPSAPYTSDNTLSKTEAYYRGQNNYSNFVSLNANRRKQMYVGANDGMLHAFDENLNERWAFALRQ
jgi:type IV pilus assembly protein PilY1